VLKSLFARLDEAHIRDDVVAAVLVGAGSNFSAGFDITLFRAPPGEQVDGAWVNAEICRTVESGPKPVVAAVRGLCLGGGCEIAVACAGRVVAPDARIGLPELQLGIIPGFGGTQRLPRLVGCAKGTQMILNSQPLTGGGKLVEAGLADAVAGGGRGELEETAAARAFAIARGRVPRNITLERTDRLEPSSTCLAILAKAEAGSKAQAPNLTHPLLALEAIRSGLIRGGAAGLAVEGQAFLASQRLPTHAGLVRIFFGQRATKRVRGVEGLAPRPLRKAAVVGGGLMGSGIATAFATAGIEVLLKEVAQGPLDLGLGRVRSNIEARVRRGALSADKGAAAIARVKGALDYSRFGEVDLAVEAVIESVDLKRKIFAELERACRKDCVLATNTSTIDLDLISQGLPSGDTSRLVGAHFFSPAHIMPLLEIVRSKTTQPQLVADLLGLSGQIRKTPVVAGNCTGFCVNRVFFPYTMAASLLSDSGVDLWSIDAALGPRGFGMPMGPFRLADLVGGDISLAVGGNFLRDFPERSYASRLIPLMNEAGRLGEKTGKGYYDHGKGQPRGGAPARTAVGPIVVASRAAAPAGLAGALDALLSGKMGGAKSGVGRVLVAEAILFPVVNEASRVPLPSSFPFYRFPLLFPPIPPPSFPPTRHAAS